MNRNKKLQKQAKFQCPKCGHKKFKTLDKLDRRFKCRTCGQEVRNNAR